MCIGKTHATLHTIKVLHATNKYQPRYVILLETQEVLQDFYGLEEAISYLRELGHSTVQLVNGPDVYILTWGPPLAPWEGEPG